MYRVTLLVLLCVGYLGAEKTVIHLEPEKVGSLLQSAMACLLENPLDPETIAQIRNGQTPKNANEKNLQKFVYCAAIKGGYAEKDGHFKPDKVVEVYPKDVDREKIKKTLDECNKEEGKNPSETALRILRCFREKTPYRVVL